MVEVSEVPELGRDVAGERVALQFESSQSGEQQDVRRDCACEVVVGQYEVGYAAVRVCTNSEPLV